LYKSFDTYYWYKRWIQKEDAKIWDKVHIDSAKYRAGQLIQLLEECYLLTNQQEVTSSLKSEKTEHNYD
jgi:hypothetical protein